MNDWDELKLWLEDANYSPVSENPFYLRFFQAANDGVSGKDLAVLIRGILRNESESNGGQRILLKVPKLSSWPKPEEYYDVGIVILEEGTDYYTIYAEAWAPKWLSYSIGEEPDRPLYGLANRSHLKSVQGDPFLSEVGRQTYRCGPQRDAIRTILTSPEDATVLINLPTGTGKSLCGQLPALLFSKEEGVTVVVVPTVALALDQERALMPHIDQTSAYFSSPSRSVENEAIRHRIMDGTQRVVFASPESVLQSLDYPLQIAAQRGYFKMLVIDEAHIVDSWGESFRPSFQELAGWRRMMLREAALPFRTLLLSATVTESCLDTLETLYSGPGPFDLFSAVSLRPEPSYWMARCVSQTEKKIRLFEAINHLPRPLIVYTTEVEDATSLCSDLRAEGYNRVRAFHGNTEQDERETIIDDWQKRRLDIVVATSAFGLGVDQPEVRAVIHACVPEGIDRFYQEVGRGGRDGRACISLMLYDFEDIQLGRQMSAPKLISIEKGRPRWARMFENKRIVPGSSDKFLLPVTISPGTSVDQIDSRNDYNEQWHLRTLTMLSRMGALEFDWEKIGKIQDAEGNNWRTVRMIRHDHREDAFWEEVELYRKRSKRFDRDEFELMERLLEGKECISSLFREIYTIPTREGEDDLRRGVNVITSCGGCPACRHLGSKPSMPALSTYPLQWPPVDIITDLMRRYLDPARNQLVLLRKGVHGRQHTTDVREKMALLRTIRWFASQGIRHIVAPERYLQWLKEEEILWRRDVLFTSEIRDYARLARLKWKIPTLVIHEDCTDDSTIYRWMESPSSREYPTIFILSESMEHPTRPGQRVSDMLDIRSYQYEAFKQEVGL